MWRLAGESGASWKQDGKWDLSHEQHCNKYEISLFARQCICQNITLLPIWDIFMLLIHSNLNHCSMNEYCHYCWYSNQGAHLFSECSCHTLFQKACQLLHLSGKYIMFIAIQVFSARLWWFLTWFRYCFWWSSYASDGADNLGHPSFMLRWRQQLW